MADFFIDEIQDYLEGLCELNKQVAHKVVADNAPGGRRSFARFESEEHIAQIKNDASDKIVVVTDYYAVRVGDIEDQKLRMTMLIRFAVKKVSGGLDETNAINEAIKVAEDILLQFLSRIEFDFQNECPSLKNFEPEKSAWDKIEQQPWLDDYYGWDLTLNFITYMPEYDAEDWEEVV